MPRNDSPRILLLDIETAPITARVWGLWENNVSLNQVVADWHILSWSAKWLNAPANEIMYMDQRHAKDITNDKRILKHVWKLLDEADILITQNGVSFDHKKLNARFIQHGMQPPSSYRHIDTKRLAKKHFLFTSNKLEYMTDKLCTKYKKLKPTKFPGFELWKACLSGNMKAWQEMEKYNKHDVLSLEELYKKLIPWDNSINFNVYKDEAKLVCTCGGKAFQRRGYVYTNTSKYQCYRCKSCGSELRGRVNLLPKPKRDSLRSGTSRV